LALRLRGQRSAERHSQRAITGNRFYLDTGTVRAGSYGA